MSHRSLRSSRPSTSNSSSSSIVQRVHERLAQALAHAGPDLDPHDLAEAALAQLLLDGAEQVVGLVVDREVGVARDPEDVVVDDLHAREERVQVLGDQALERDERPAVTDREEARQHLLRHLHARERLLRGLRVADEHRERQRQVRDVGERPAEPDGERRQDREDLALEALGQLLAVARVHVGAGLDPDPVLGELRPQHALEHVGLAPRLLAHRLADRRDRLGGAAAVLARAVDPAGDVLLHPRHANHEELVEVGRVDRAELESLEERDALVLGQLQHAIVEVAPRELAVEVERVVGQVRLGGRRRVWLLQIRHGLVMLTLPGNVQRRRGARRRRTRAARGSPCAPVRPTAPGSGRRAARGGRAGARAAPRRRRARARAAPGPAARGRDRARRRRPRAGSRRPRRAAARRTPRSRGSGRRSRGSRRRGPGRPSPAWPPSPRRARSRARSARGCSAAAWRRSACRGARRPARGRRRAA